MWFLNVVLCIVNIAVPITATSDVAWKDYTENPALNGCAAYYSKSTMERTAATLGLIGKPKDYKAWLSENGYIGAVAVYRNGDKGRDIHILWPDGTIDGPYLAIDVVARNHYQLGLSRNRVIDVDYNTAIRHNMEGPVAVTIIFDNSNLFSLLYDRTNSIKTNITRDKYKGCVGN